MINKFRKIGHKTLTNIDETNDPNLRKFEFLKTNSIIPRVKKKQNLERAICLNFNLKKGYFEFKLSDIELAKENRNKFFAHSKKGSGFKIYWNTNSIVSLIKDTISHSIKNVNKLKRNKQTKRWYEKNIDPDWEILLKTIRDKFYIADSSKKQNIVLNPDKLGNSQKPILNSLKEKAKDNNARIKYTDLYKYFINIKYMNSESKSTTKFPNIAQILINNENILQYKDGKYRNSYINLVYYNFIDKYFIKAGLENKRCHLCGEKTKVLKSDSPLPFNFYGTTNSLYFHNHQNNKAYQSFALCKKCTIETFAGMKYVENNFRDYIFQNNCLIIPNMNYTEKFAPDLYKRIFRILETKNKTYKNEIDKFQHLMETSNQSNISFHLMFYFAEQNSFNILKLIQNIETINLIPKLEMFNKVTIKYMLDQIGEYNFLTLNTLIYMLFSKYQNNNIVYENKNIISFISTFFNNRKYSYTELINEFVSTFKNHLLNDKYASLTAFKMNLFLQLLGKLNMIKGVNVMEKNRIKSEILNEDYKNFFDFHHDVYKDNSFKQGLFLLGTVIAQIKKAQKEKSSTFLKKMNFSGMSTRRLQNFINSVKKYTIIYKKDVYQEPGIWGNIMDRLQGIESSNLSPHEVVFYILSGISFSEYLGMKKSYDNKIEESTSMEE